MCACVCYLILFISHQYGKHDFRLAVSDEMHGLQLILRINGKQWNLQKLFNLLGNVQFRCDLLLVSRNNNWCNTACWRMYASHLVHALGQFDGHVVSYYLFRSIHLHGTVHFATVVYRVLFDFIVVSSDREVSVACRDTVTSRRTGVDTISGLFKNLKSLFVRMKQKTAVCVFLTKSQFLLGSLFHLIFCCVANIN